MQDIGEMTPEEVELYRKQNVNLQKEEGKEIEQFSNSLGRTLAKPSPEPVLDSCWEERTPAHTAVLCSVLRGTTHLPTPGTVRSSFRISISSDRISWCLKTFGGSHHQAGYRNTGLCALKFLMGPAVGNPWELSMAAEVMGSRAKLAKLKALFNYSLPLGP